MRGIIFCKNYTSANTEGVEMLKHIIQQYEKIEINCIFHISPSGNSSYADFYNGDSWRVVVANESGTCGRRCNIAYVERSIDYKTYCCLISPCLYDFPYSAVRLWGEGNLHINDTPDLPFR